MNIGEVCNREVVIIESDASISRAAKLMRKYHVGDLVVTMKREGENIPIGIITDRDIVIKALALDMEPDSATVGEIMSLELLTAREEDPLMETVKQMRNKGVRRIPVVNQRGGLEGILSVDDLLELFAEQLNDFVGLISREQKRESGDTAKEINSN